jgi:hypothetical protein
VQFLGNVLDLDVGHVSNNSMPTACSNAKILETGHYNRCSLGLPCNTIP